MTQPQSQTSTVRGSAPVWVAMFSAFLIVAATAYWDARREASAALADFAGAQVALATGLADPGCVTAHDGRRRDIAGRPVDGDATRRETRASCDLVRAVGESGLLRTDGVSIRSPVIEDASKRGAAWVRLSREEAEALTLPARTAIAGLAHIADGPASPWSIVVVATAQEERDRELRAQWRLVLGVTWPPVLVFAFGGLALRKQRKELELARELAVAEVQRERDERLVRADKLATMGAFATGIAHEVSTPLGVIMGRAEQLLPKVGGRREGAPRSRRRSSSRASV